MNQGRRYHGSIVRANESKIETTIKDFVSKEMHGTRWDVDKCDGLCLGQQQKGKDEIGVAGEVSPRMGARVDRPPGVVG